MDIPFYGNVLLRDEELKGNHKRIQDTACQTYEINRGVCEKNLKRTFQRYFSEYKLVNNLRSLYNIMMKRRCGGESLLSESDFETRETSIRKCCLKSVRTWDFFKFTKLNSFFSLIQIKLFGNRKTSKIYV